MSGISASGLITGINSATLISQLMQLERQPLIRYEDRIEELENEQEVLRDLRSTLQNLRNRAQDYRLSNIFDAYAASSSDEEVMTSTVTSPNPVSGAFDLNVTHLATATVAESSGAMGSPIDLDLAISNSGIAEEVEDGTFTINGVEFTVSPTTTSMQSVFNQINASDAGVTVTYDAVTDKATFTNSTPGDTNLINFGASEDESNFLDVLGVTGATQATDGSGSTSVTSTQRLGRVVPSDALNTINFSGGAVTAGTFSINGVEISVDPTSDTLLDIAERITSSDAGVTASYDASIDGIRIVSDTLGSRTVRFGGASDTSNFLSVTNLDTASQTAGSDAQFTINGGPVQTRNTNEVADAISGVTLRFLSTGESTVTVASDDDSIVEDVQEFISSFNDVVNELRSLTDADGDLSGDSSIRSIETTLRSQIFSRVMGLGDFESFLDIGISTGEDFDSTSVANLELDEDDFREALREDRNNVEQLFSNEDGTGIADVFYTYLDDMTKATGFLNNRAKANGTIDQQISGINDQVRRLEDRLEQRETRLRRQFTQLETISATYQNQASSLSALGSF